MLVMNMMMTESSDSRMRFAAVMPSIDRISMSIRMMSESAW